MSAVALQSATRAPEVGSQAAIDLERMPVEKVLAQLAVKPEQGLSSAEARERLAKYGPNALVEKEVSLLRQIVGHFTGPNAYMIEPAAIVSAVIGHWDDFAIIAALLYFNAALEFWQDRKASNALAALRKGARPRSHRDARRQVAGSCDGDAGARRHRQDQARRHRAGRPAACRRRVRLHRSGGADRRILACCKEGGRRSLFGQHRQAGRDARRRHRDRPQHLLRSHRQARG